MSFLLPSYQEMTNEYNVNGPTNRSLRQAMAHQQVLGGLAVGAIQIERPRIFLSTQESVIHLREETL